LPAWRAAAARTIPHLVLGAPSVRRTIALAAVAAALSWPLAGMAQTTDVAGVKFPNSVQIGSSKLQLNGAGIRHKVVFKVYAAGLYLTEKASTPEAVLATPGPRRLQIVMLRDIDGNELGKLFTKGMEDNAPREEFSKSIAGILRMSDIFSTRKKLLAGESFALEWLPGTGTVISVNGKPEGAPVREPEFFSVLMKIWLGKSPADAQLKEALLGKAAATPGNGAYNN
jgi:Chalcone isomerase-like